MSHYLAGLLGGGLSPLSLAVALAGGLLAGFGPCVLPMVPAVFGYVTGQVVTSSECGGTSSERLRAVGLSAVFVLGMAAVFTLLGVAAGSFGRALAPGAWSYYLLAAICLVLGLHMLGVVTLPFDRLNRWLPARRPGSHTGGLLGALVLGAMFGLVASPCSTPVLAAIAAMAAAGRDPFGGGVLLFVFGIGKGTPLLLLGLASGSLSAMRAISSATPVLGKLGGAALVGTAAYLVWIA